MITGIVLIAAAIVILFFVFSKKNKNTGEISSFVTSSSEAPVADISRYDYFLEKYNIAEKSVIEKADREIKKVQIQLDATSDAIKKIFLQSFIDHYKYDY